MFMSTEQLEKCESERLHSQRLCPLDGRSDLFSLGVTMYQVPFESSVLHAECTLAMILAMIPHCQCEYAARAFAMFGILM
jgi:hypothetical protein